MQSVTVHKTALSAWLSLVETGGLEAGGRDAPLVEKLRGEIDASAPSIETALSGITVEGFLNAFFGVIRPLSWNDERPAGVFRAGQRR